MKFKRQVDLSYPQVWEYVHLLLGDLKDGFFVDVGAYDGTTITNTHFYEDVLNWKGICIEPNPDAYKSLINNRDCICYNFGISDIESELTFRKVNGYAEMLSGFLDFFSQDHINRIDSEIKKHGGSYEDILIKSRRLDSILKENNITKIDYLSIDTEGHEMKVLNSINFDECFIKIISSEKNDKNNIVSNFLEQKGYTFISNIGGDDIFMKK